MTLKLRIKLYQALKRALKEFRPKDFKRAVELFEKNDWESLLELVKSIVSVEAGKKRPDRILNFPLLLESHEILQDYINEINNE